MKINEFYKMIQKKPIILDGATGSNLQKAGMKPGVCPEEWILENEDKLIALQKAFVEAGTNILYAPTFRETALSWKNMVFQNALKK